MRVQIFSDLHAGVAPLKRITVAKDVALVIVAGDVAEGAQNAFVTLRRIVPEAVPVVFTMGNHEYYRRFLGEELALARALAPNFNIHLLENDCIVVGDGTVRVAGASLWTDYRMFGDSNAPAAMHAARVGMNDHRLIGWKRKPWERFRPQEAALLHAASRAFFVETFSTPFDGLATIAVSHHAPHVGSVAARFENDILSAAFASTFLDELNSGRQAGVGPLVAATPKAPDFWIHGHVHDSADYRVGPTRVIANPHGYGRENADFDPTLVIEVGS
ncbi:metallophosphoesterase [Bradyrhizobium sp. Ash2021]|uniref:metallophosphoesterase n=1 Tax=Bradyrhizobium sp. Ash2021 TaxID=2954771 RepID=UPI002815D502|nr:metallophosphoesterase [Bradyrhizobium sp. Ash2021]WMT76478.1 metallophosphoesterase [Bradyrhizobium sp. Ash2021]